MKQHDDDQPADAAWLRSVGFEDVHSGMSWAGVEVDSRTRSVKVWVSPRSVLHMNGTDIIYHPTRRQVRLICEAVGVALNDVEQEANA